MSEKTTNIAPPPEVQTKLSGDPADVPIIHILYQNYVFWHLLVLKFPKSERYSLGQRTGDQLLDAIEAILTAAATSHREVKLQQLRKASAKLDLLRLLIRLCKDCKCISNEAYQEHESKIHEAGRMLGGWIKSLT